MLAAAALKCLGGELQGRLMPANANDYQRCKEMGMDDPFKVLTMDDMVGSEDVIFAATGVTPGEFLGGVRYLPDNRAENPERRGVHAGLRENLRTAAVPFLHRIYFFH
ncbi:fructose-bisphosphatase class II [Micromonospora schwarzwaldensis]